VQHLGQVGFHAAALSGSQNNDGKLAIGHQRARTSLCEKGIGLQIIELVERNRLPSDIRAECGTGRIFPSNQHLLPVITGTYPK
jgi:hypothetical protein